MRVKADALVQCLLPMVDPKAERESKPLAKGLPAGPGGAHGMVVFTADEAARRGKELHEKVILVRTETSPEDVHGMHAAQAILTAKGGMTSHAALVARGWGKCCIVGCSGIEVDMDRKVLKAGGKEIPEGEWITLNGTSGTVYEGKLPLVDPDLREQQGPPPVHEVGGRLPQARRAHERRHAAGRAEGAGVRRRGHRPVPHRAHVLRRRRRPAALPAAQDDRQQHRSRSAARPSTSSTRS